MRRRYRREEGIGTHRAAARQVPYRSDGTLISVRKIHPRTIGPLLPQNIPCVIKNTGNPSAPGSIIDGNVKSESLQVKGITNLDNLAMFNVSGPGMQGMVWHLAYFQPCQAQAFQLF